MSNNKKIKLGPSPMGGLNDAGFYVWVLNNFPKEKALLHLDDPNPVIQTVCEMIVKGDTYEI